MTEEEVDVPEVVRDILLTLAVSVSQVERADDDSASETSRARDEATEETGGCVEEGAVPERPSCAAPPRRQRHGTPWRDDGVQCGWPRVGRVPRTTGTANKYL